MAQGLLEIKGVIDLEQFWPEGEADADTTKVKVTVDKGAFRFRPHPGAAFKATSAFEKAEVRGRVRKPVIDKERRVVIRLQGIDAPELHYTPQGELKRSDRTKQQHDLYLEWNYKYRQHLGESATVALSRFLAKGGKDPLPCRVVTAIDEPSDAIDTYGRFVGDILVTIKGKPVNVNQWLARQGWTVPGFYSSMSENEIKVLASASEAARTGKRGVWPFVADEVGSFDFKLRYRRQAENDGDDEGPVLNPKLFRRVAAWAVNRRAKMVTGSFDGYLKKKKEACYLTEEFLVQGPFASTPHGLHEFVEADGDISVGPEGLVYQEAQATLVGPGGKEPKW